MATSTVAPTAARATGVRVVSLDAFRGFTMIFLTAEGFLSALNHHPLLGALARQFEHTDWHGATPWDMVQPFFMFIVGAAMPFSFARRWESQESYSSTLLHVLKRCALLILWGLVARSVEAGRPVIDLINVLAQVSFTYFVAFLVLRKGWRIQAATAFAFLAADWALYTFVSAPGVTGAWVKDANIGYWLDGAVLSKHWSGSYATINCIPSTANTIFGVMAGGLLRSSLDMMRKLRILVMTGVAGVAAGLLLDPWIPIIKKIWTPSFALLSAGWTLLALALFVWVSDVKGWQRWSRIAVMVGSNSIFIYLFHEILGNWMRTTAHVFLGWSVDWWGDWGRVFTACAVAAFQISVCVWLYRRKIFFKL